MRNREREDEARRMRACGMTYKTIGQKLGVSANTARLILCRLQREESLQESISQSPFYGLSDSTQKKLYELGFCTKEDCEILCRNDLTVRYGRVFFGEKFAPSGKDLWVLSRTNRLSFTIVNEVRAWLGVAPFTPVPREASASELKRAKRMLERYGYKVVLPDCNANKA